ncbi:MAG: ABC transporter permease [Candidatus Hodarchaeota archaeon]
MSSSDFGVLDEEKLKQLEKEKEKRRRVGRFVIFLKRFRKNRMAILGAFIILFMVFLGVFAPLIAGPGRIVPYGPRDTRIEAEFIPPLSYEMSLDKSASQKLMNEEKTIAGIYNDEKIEFINGISQTNLSYYKQLSKIDHIVSKSDESELWGGSEGEFNQTTGQIILSDRTFSGNTSIDYRIGGKFAFKIRPTESNIAMIWLKMSVETTTQESRWDTDIYIHIFDSNANFETDEPLHSAKIKGSYIMTGTGLGTAYSEFHFGSRGKTVTPSQDYWVVIDSQLLEFESVAKYKRLLTSATTDATDPLHVSVQNWNAITGWNTELAAADEGWLPHTRIFYSTNRFHIFGTDSLGRDMLSAVIHGARASLTVAFLAVTVQVIIGVLTGAIAGYYGGFIDNALMRITDVFLAIPLLFLILIAITIWEQINLVAMAFTIGFLGWSGTARIVRAEFLSLREMEFTDAARALGVSTRSIIFKHLLPNAMAPVIVTATLGTATAILIESGLSFLGFGDPLATSWGQAIQWGILSLRFAPWVATIPGLAIFVTVLGFNLMGDGLRDALDPRLRD